MLIRRKNMYTVWKYKIEPDICNQVYKMPAGAVILSAGLDADNELCFWARVNPDAQLEEHVVACVGTGWPLDALFNERIDKYVCFIGTVARGNYVWHLFDMGAGPAQINTELHPEAAGGARQ
jgi:hypothetical protein